MNPNLALDAQHLIIDPRVKLRMDGNRALLFSVNDPDGIGDYCFRFLYPQEAIVLSLFDGWRDLKAVKMDVAYLFNLEIDEASRRVDEILALYVNRDTTISSLIIDASNIDLAKARKYNPTDFILPVEKIDMSNKRCKLPIKLFVLPTMRCYTKCRYCYADRDGFQGNEFSLQFFKKLLKIAKDCEIENIEFSGGDLFCRSDALELIECTIAEGLHPSIPTKYPLSKEQIDKLAGFGLSTIQISIDALDPSIIDGLVAVQPGYGKKILQTLTNLGESGIKVRTNSVMTPYNIHDAPNLARYLAQLPHVFKINFTCYGRSIYNHDDSMFCSSKEVNEFENAFNQIRTEFPDKPMFFSGIPEDPYVGDEASRSAIFQKRAFCTAAHQTIIVLPDGRATICEELYFNENYTIGDLTKSTLMEVWNSQKAFDIVHPNQAMVPDGACKDCLDYYKCHNTLGRCYREVIKAYGSDRHYWPDPRCPRAPRGNRMV